MPPSTQQVVEQQGLLDQIAQTLLRAAPGQWRYVVAEFRIMGRHVELSTSVVLADGAALPLPPPVQVVEMCVVLRRNMHAPDTGAWFTARFQVQADGRMGSEFDYDNEPYWQNPPPATAFGEDLRAFPRLPDRTPRWLRERAAREASEAQPAGSGANTADQLGGSGMGTAEPFAGSGMGPTDPLATSVVGATDPFGASGAGPTDPLTGTTITNVDPRSRSGMNGADPFGGPGFHPANPPGAPGSTMANPLTGQHVDAGGPLDGSSATTVYPPAGSGNGPETAVARIELNASDTLATLSTNMPDALAESNTASMDPFGGPTGDNEVPSSGAGVTGRPSGPLPEARPANAVASRNGEPTGVDPEPPREDVRPQQVASRMGVGAPVPPVRFRNARTFDRQGPDGRPVVRRRPVPPDMVPGLLAYLEGAPVVRSSDVFEIDLLDQRPNAVPLALHTDGVWVWPAAVAYYLRQHGVPPDPALIEHIVQQRFEPPAVDEATLAAAHAHLDRRPRQPAAGTGERPWAPAENRNAEPSSMIPPTTVLAPSAVERGRVEPGSVPPDQPSAAAGEAATTWFGPGIREQRSAESAAAPSDSAARRAETPTQLVDSSPQSVDASDTASRWIEPEEAAKPTRAFDRRSAPPPSTGSPVLRELQRLLVVWDADPQRYRIREVADGAWCLLAEDQEWVVFCAREGEQHGRAAFTDCEAAGRYLLGAVLADGDGPGAMAGDDGAARADVRWPEVDPDDGR
ncbi:hypothetical protein GCM10012275_32770 [Longimycelium tulufanense]|uniref:Uncharacterized protein n=1 Tax=Longimycelium tulufanense TaxID=907463 RepID=A0A8J3CF25_9PSEU|nr:hypothetical protein [Longimycelium tulufanense]GGM59085.1 hypothetical protein GCM10012275_32770 [Longimycelium tulufanense]